MNEVSHGGVAILMVWCEVGEIVGMSDGVVVIDEGSIRGELNKGEGREEGIMRLARGGK